VKDDALGYFIMRLFSGSVDTYLVWILSVGSADVNNKMGISEIAYHLAHGLHRQLGRASRAVPHSPSTGYTMIGHDV
jgi:hypothetical protein